MADKDFVVKNGLVTGANNTTFGTAVTLVSNGNVGIANTTPANKLVVTGSITATANVSAASVNASTGFYGTVQTATQGTIDHNTLANYTADRHIAHSGVSISAGNGLTGGGTIDSNRSLAVVAGTGIVSNTAGVHVTNVPNAVTFNNGGSGGASGTTFNGSSAVTISYNSVGAPSTTGNDASGTWSININGSAASATNASAATNANFASTAASVSSVSISALPSGSWTLLNTLTASNSSALNDTTNFTSSYKYYVIVLQNILPVNNGAGLNMTVQSGGVFQTSSYSGFTFLSNIGTNAHAPGGSYSSAFSLSSGSRINNAAGGGMDGNIWIPNPSQTSSYKQIQGQVMYWDQSGGNYYSWAYPCGAWRGGTGAITGVQFAMSSGNISSGEIRIYGVKL